MKAWVIGTNGLAGLSPLSFKPKKTTKAINIRFCFWHPHLIILKDRQETTQSAKFSVSLVTFGSLVFGGNIELMIAV